MKSKDIPLFGSLGESYAAILEEHKEHVEANTAMGTSIRGTVVNVAFIKFLQGEVKRIKEDPKQEMTAGDLVDGTVAVFASMILTFQASFGLDLSNLLLVIVNNCEHSQDNVAFRHDVDLKREH